MARRSAYVAAAGFAAAAVAAAVALMPNAMAGTRPAGTSVAGTDAVAPALLAAVQRDFGLSADQARLQLTKERIAGDTDTAIRGAIGNRHAGSWLGSNGTLTVAVTDGASADLVRKAGAQPKLVARSLASLDAAKNRLDAVSGKVALGGIPAWHVDVATNQVVVFVHAGAQATATSFVKAAGIDAGAVRYETSTLQPRTLIDIIGGNAYTFGAGRCSVGFSVTNGGFMTAGHCGTTGTRTSNPAGRVAGSNFPGNDYAWVRADPGNTPRPLVNGYPGLLPVRGSAQAPVQSTVCRSGSTTGRHCGRVQAYNASVRYPEGLVQGLIRTNVCAEPGDSGGSLLWNDQAQGVTSGGSGNCSSGGETFFQPVSEIIQVFGLTLATEGGGPTTTPPRTTPPRTTNPPQTTSPPGGGTTWAPNTAYTIGDVVTYDGQRYQCRQSHTSLTGWEPPNVLALWLPI